MRGRNIRDEVRTSESMAPGGNTSELIHHMMVGDPGKYNISDVPGMTTTRGDDLDYNDTSVEGR